MKPTLYLMLGYPGAGKSTAAGIIHSMTGAVYLESDALRCRLFPDQARTQEEHRHIYNTVYETLNYFTELLLRDGISVIYDANLNRTIHRQEKYDIATRTQAIPKLLWVQTPREVAKVRAMHESRLHLAPQDETLSLMFDRIADIIEPPTPDEHPLILDGTKPFAEQLERILGD